MAEGAAKEGFLRAGSRQGVEGRKSAQRSGSPSGQRRASTGCVLAGPANGAVVFRRRAGGGGSGGNEGRGAQSAAHTGRSGSGGTDFREPKGGRPGPRFGMPSAAYRSESASGVG